MERGDTVKIWLDPITREKPEGKAKLLKRVDSGARHSDMDGPMQRWLVKFLDDYDLAVERNIYTG